MQEHKPRWAIERSKKRRKDPNKYFLEILDGYFADNTFEEFFYQVCSDRTYNMWDYLDLVDCFAFFVANFPDDFRRFITPRCEIWLSDPFTGEYESTLRQVEFLADIKAMCVEVNSRFGDDIKDKNCD